MLEFYSYRLAVRDDHSLIHYGKKLFQQSVVDYWVKVEQQRLDFIRLNQKQLRADTYKGLTDSLAHRSERDNMLLGRVFVLPSTFTDSERNKNQNYHDSMSIVSMYGKPDYFLTFTCNPNWPEITAELYPGQIWSDRPDVVARVFKLKLDELVEDIRKIGIFFAALYYNTNFLKY